MSYPYLWLTKNEVRWRVYWNHFVCAWNDKAAEFVAAEDVKGLFLEV